MSFKTVKKEASAEFVEKRSRFIGYIRPVQTEAEAVTFVNEIRAAHRDATHNCYAYTVRENNMTRYSDDGEPHGTAGLPILEVLRGTELCDAAVVVTRYFGGTLLGTGGLVRAYTRGAQEAVAAGGIAEIAECARLRLLFEYSYFERVKLLLEREGGVLLDQQFSDRVALEVRLRSERRERFEAALVDLSFGSAEVQFLETVLAAE